MTRWKRLNPRYTIQLFTDRDVIDYLAVHFPWAVAMFGRVKGPIRADLFRTLYLSREGGCYTDIDVVPLVGIDAFDLRMPTLWVPTALRNENACVNPTVIVARARDPLLLAATDVYRRMTWLPRLEHLYWDVSVVSIYSTLYEKGWAVDARAKEIFPFANGSDSVYDVASMYDVYVESGSGKRLFMVRDVTWDWLTNGEVQGS